MHSLIHATKPQQLAIKITYISSTYLIPNPTDQRKRFITYRLRMEWCEAPGRARGCGLLMKAVSYFEIITCSLAGCIGGLVWERHSKRGLQKRFLKMTLKVKQLFDKKVSVKKGTLVQWVFRIFFNPGNFWFAEVEILRNKDKFNKHLSGSHHVLSHWRCKDRWSALRSTYQMPSSQLEIVNMVSRRVNDLTKNVTIIKGDNSVARC